MKIDWGKVSIEFVHGDNTVKFHFKEEFSSYRLCYEDIDLKKEKKKGSEIIIALIFDMEEEIKEKKVIAELEEVLKQF